ncbi:MAG: putative chemotaxis protein CheA [Firmicutes bacterium]|nr:putative chemotaxis protein CheA [Bacillota bacterium]
MTENDFSREPMLDMFLFETNQLIEQLEEIIIKCEQDRRLDNSDVNEIFRIMHSIKGSAAMMLFNDISLLAHSLEDLFFFIREKSDIQLDFAKLSDLVLAGIDFIKEEIIKIKTGNNAGSSSEELISINAEYLSDLKSEIGNNDEVGADSVKRIQQYYISNYQATTGKEITRYYARIFFDENCQMENVRAYTVIHNLGDIAEEIYYLPEDLLENSGTSEIIKNDGFELYFSTDKPREEVEKLLNDTMFLRTIEISVSDESLISRATLHKSLTVADATEELSSINSEANLENGKGTETSVNAKQQSMISVNVVKLDTLMDLVGEIVIAEAMVTRNPDLDGLVLDNFYKAARQLRKLTNELQDIVMSIRMVPVAMTFQKMNRIVRDMSRKLEKEIELVIIGETTEVDKNIIERLSDPLMHIIRNAVDHGLEDQTGRLAAGKPIKGKITLEARNVGGDVWITVQDDGKGLDRDKILTKARERGLVNKIENELSDKEIYSYIMLPGFSTSDKVTEFSGRGVGMDVVRKNVEEIGGTITIESTLGRGSEFNIKIPLTLAIIDGMLVSAGRAKYTIPTTSIRESFKASEDDVIADSAGNEIIMLRGQCYQVLRLHKLFKLDGAGGSVNDGIMVMIEGEDKAVCLFADRLIGEQQVVVKALPAYLKRINGIAGCTILGDGSISLILDVNALIKKQM